MRPPSKGVRATMLGRGAKAHVVECRVRLAGPALVEVEILRDNRRRAEGDQSLVLTVTEARELMRALQGTADEANRRHYQASKAAEVATKVELGLERDVAAVAEALDNDHPTQETP